jgi:hypothetical protein
MESARRYPDVVCQLHAGMINASLEEMTSGYRLEQLYPRVTPHQCEGRLGPVPDQPRTSVDLVRTWKSEPEATAPSGGGDPTAA